MFDTLFTETTLKECAAVVADPLEFAGIRNKEEINKFYQWFDPSQETDSQQGTRQNHSSYD